MTGPRYNPDLLKVPVYIAGRSAEEVQAELGLEEVTKLSSNESPIGPSQMAVAAAVRMLEDAHRYPGSSDRDLRRKLAAHLDDFLEEGNILIGNGGTDILRMITQAFVFHGGNTIMSRATFPMYRILTHCFGGTPWQIESAPGYRHDLICMAESIDDDTRIVYLCSPNNPSGDVITQAEADAFLALVPDHVVVVFDESYLEFVTDPNAVDSLAYVRTGQNVISVRSFSKTAGLANLRVGYAVGPEELVGYLQHAQLPFNTGAIAIAAASASLDDRDYLRRNRQAVIQGREYLYDQLRALDLNCLPSQANFVTLIDPPMGAEALTDALLRQGMIVRPMALFGIPDAVRVSVGSQVEMEQFISALKSILVEVP